MQLISAQAKCLKYSANF